MARANINTCPASMGKRSMAMARRFTRRAHGCQKSNSWFDVRCRAMDARDRVLLLPDGAGPHPGVVLGSEAYGVNEFIISVGEWLASQGCAVFIPDYYEGGGPSDREA